MIPAADALAITADALIFQGRGVMRGYSIAETGGSNDGLATIYDGTSNGGLRRLDLYVPKSTAASSLPGGGFFAVERGLYVDVTSGTVAITIFYNTQTRYLDLLNVFNNEDTDVSRFHLDLLLSGMEAH